MADLSLIMTGVATVSAAISGALMFGLDRTARSIADSLTMIKGETPTIEIRQDTRSDQDGIGDQ
jgi:hypothetical protein